MSAEAKVFSPQQLKYQRLFDVRPHGETAHPEARGLEKAGANAAALSVGLVVDLTESHIVKHFKNATFEKVIKKHEENTDYDKAANTKGYLGAFEFVEEWASDKAYSDIMNKWLQKKTGVEGATYASEASVFISEWSNAIAQVFFKNKLIGATKKELDGFETKILPKTALGGWLFLAHPLENFINPITVEASLRIAEQVPLIGGAVGWSKEKLSHALEHSSALKYGNSAAAKALTGYHIFRNVAA